MTNHTYSKTKTLHRVADTLADLYASGLSDQYGIKWLKARATALGYSVEVKKRGPRNLYRFCGIDRRPYGLDHYTPTDWMTLPKARSALDAKPNLLEVYRLPADIVHATDAVGYWPNPTALCDRMIEAIVAYVAALPQTCAFRHIRSGVPTTYDQPFRSIRSPRDDAVGRGLVMAPWLGPVMCRGCSASGAARAAKRAP